MTALVQNALQAVRLAFRIGSYVDSLSQRLFGTLRHIHPNYSNTWACVVQNLSLTEAKVHLTEFNHGHVCNPPIDSYIVIIDND